MKDLTKLVIIIDEVCQFYDVRFEQLAQASRERKYVEPRHTICYYAKKYTGLSLAPIGEILNRDHTSVLYGQKAIDNLICYAGYGIFLQPLADRLESRFLNQSVIVKCPLCKRPMP